MQRSKLFSMYVSTGTYSDFADMIITKAQAGESDYACVANVHMLVETYKDNSFAQSVNDASLITPDGKPLTWALRMMHDIKQDRVAGMDLLPDLLKISQQQKMPVYFYGGSEEMLRKTERYLHSKFPTLLVAGMYSPPFRPLAETEENDIVNMINASAAKLVFVILGCPKQERWMASMKGRVNAYMIGVGGALPVLIGMQKRAPKWMQVGGLEWLYRLAQEPRRLFTRYALTNSLFLYLFFKAYLQKKFLQSAS